MVYKPNTKRLFRLFRLLDKLYKDETHIKYEYTTP